MNHPYPDMTVQEILAAFRSHSRSRILVNAPALLVCIGLPAVWICGLVRDFNVQTLVFVLLTLPMFGVLCWYCIRNIRRNMQVMQGDSASPYGSPEDIAAVLADPQNVQAISSRKVILTRSYLMQKNDVTSFIPLAEIVSLYVVSSKRNLFLLTVTRDGRKQSVRIERGSIFRSPEKQKQQLIAELDAHLQKHAPHLRANQ
ncbi:MAG TPA: hypothetical protein DDX71_07335 [Ruminococcus sp.]|nr:hypothetical protein [Ruminococcus sp.]